MKKLGNAGVQNIPKLNCLSIQFLEVNLQHESYEYLYGRKDLRSIPHRWYGMMSYDASRQSRDIVVPSYCTVQKYCRTSLTNSTRSYFDCLTTSTHSQNRHEWMPLYGCDGPVARIFVSKTSARAKCRGVWRGGDWEKEAIRCKIGSGLDGRQ